ELEEGSPDHPGEAIEVAETASAGDGPTVTPGTARVTPIVPSGDAPRSTATNAVVPAAIRQKIPPSEIQARLPNSTQPVSSPAPLPTSGTVVVDVEQAGLLVPSFAGKSVRSAIELAQASGLELEVVGSGVAQEQSPPAGSHVANGSRITV